ncbi:MAG: hypothetical protein HY680_05570 [Chloroflexi bacterium]|nr:hypothetical protein [Chloroflexota bacterium]
MNNAQLARVFDHLAGLSVLKGESAFVARAYRRASHSIQTYPVELERYVQEGGDLRDIPGVGEAISKKITELQTTGRLELYERLKAEFPEGLLQIMDISGVGPKTALRLCQELGVTSVAELQQAATLNPEKVGAAVRKALSNYLKTPFGTAP